MGAAVPAERFLTTPSGKINFRNALARRRFMRRQFRGAGYGKHICAAALRTDLRNAVSRKETTPEQTRWIGEQFPLRERKSKNKAAEPVKAAA